ncbi:hypothetical protein SBOR_7988 [Sclerotinia borealis F-4128]|uniref:CT20 family protein n=1 Tax=Sclerotinia borealis (strain F-4128) TaxID=1432307 RepID=W9C6Y5_SCLBF|nr:hypothetical protein SBOR_7988 [Sclerotinia borealis F-4128]
MAKRKKGSTRGASNPAEDQDTMAIDTPQKAELPKPSYDILKDPWTDEQETSLFKGIVKWKPADQKGIDKLDLGMHKHFRMIALSEHLRNHGYDPRVDQHTRIPGIWKKLRTCYNLDVIDDRENSFDYEDDTEDRFPEFTLPDDVYGEMCFMRGKRTAKEISEAPSSPPRLMETSEPKDSPEPEIQGTTKKRKRGKERGSTVDTAETRTSPPTHSSPPRSTRAGRSAIRAAGKAKAGSNSRQQSIATVATEEDGVEDDQEREEDQNEESIDGTPTRPRRVDTKKTRAQSSTRKSKRKR